MHAFERLDSGIRPGVRCAILLEPAGSDQVSEATGGPENPWQEVGRPPR